MGVVWRAHHELVHKDVAIKIMRREYVRDAKVMERFRREATAAGRIGNTHICDILDFGESEIGPFMVMEMLEGESLESFFDRLQTLDSGLIVLIVRQALLGLEAAHRAGIVHRDLKPENIFLHEPRPGHLLVKLMDFGISKFSEDLGGGKTGHGVLMGTPEYMSPEQFEGAAKVDALTDIWAMGVLLYRGLTGVMPFQGKTLGELLMQVTSHTPRAPAELVDNLDPALSELVMRCLSRAGADRPSSAQTLHSLLGPHETMSPTAAAESMTAVSARSKTASEAAAASASPPVARDDAAVLGGDDSWSGGSALGAALDDDAWTMGERSASATRRQRRRARRSGRMGWIAGMGLVAALAGVVGVAWFGADVPMPAMLQGVFATGTAPMLAGDTSTGDEGEQEGDAGPRADVDTSGVDTTESGEGTGGDEGSSDVETSGTGPGTTGAPDALGDTTGVSAADNVTDDGTTGDSDAPEAMSTGTTAAPSEAPPVVRQPRTPKPRQPVDMTLVIESEGRFVQKALGPKTDYRGARSYCAKLRRKSYANLTKWRVPTTGSILRFFKKIDPVVVWTSTRSDGGREVVRMLNGFIEVVDDSSQARAVCTSRG
jgi:tRNA A-37 threonylcarbamoyl transferase component Bud32